MPPFLRFPGPVKGTLSTSHAAQGRGREGIIATPGLSHLLVPKCHPSSVHPPATPRRGAAPSTAPTAGAWLGERGDPFGNPAGRVRHSAQHSGTLQESRLPSLPHPPSPPRTRPGPRLPGYHPLTLDPASLRSLLEKPPPGEGIRAWSPQLGEASASASGGHGDTCAHSLSLPSHPVLRTRLFLYFKLSSQFPPAIPHNSFYLSSKMLPCALA